MSDEKVVKAAALRAPSAEEKAMFLALAKKSEAEAKYFEAQTTRELADAETSQFHANEKRRKEEEVLSSNFYNNLYTFAHIIDDATVALCIEVLSRWSRLKPGSDITLVISSPGGSLIAGMALYDFLLDLRAKGHRLTTISRGYAASMASVILQAGTDRVAGRESWMLIHKGSLSAAGDVDTVVDQVTWVKRIGERVIDIYASRAATAKKKDKEKIAEFIRTNWERKDFWISSEEALKYGFVDRIEGTKK